MSREMTPEERAMAQLRSSRVLQDRLIARLIGREVAQAGRAHVRKVSGIAAMRRQTITIIGDFARSLAPTT